MAGITATMRLRQTEDGHGPLLHAESGASLQSPSRRARCRVQRLKCVLDDVPSSQRWKRERVTDNTTRSYRDRWSGQR